MIVSRHLWSGLFSENRYGHAYHIQGYGTRSDRGNWVAPVHTEACLKILNFHCDSKLQNSLTDYFLPAKKAPGEGVTHFLSAGSRTIVNPGQVDPCGMWGGYYSADHELRNIGRK